VSPLRCPGLPHVSLCRFRGPPRAWLTTWWPVLSRSWPMPPDGSRTTLQQVTPRH